jgi:ABC-type glycerol-3-phosphate transport system permease component
MGKYQGVKVNPKKFHKSQIKFYLILIPIAIFMVIPIIYVFSTAFKPLEELFAFPPRVMVQNPTLSNFESLFQSMSKSGIPASRYLFNSVMVSSISVFLSVVVSTTAAYALSKKNFKHKDLFFSINTLALMFVPIAVTIPRYLIIANLGLVDSYAVHILPMLAMPVGLFLMKQNMDQLPDELLEAGMIDGANDWQRFRKIVVPIIAPSIATIAILSFQASWNTTEASMLYINDESIKTFAYYITTLTSTGNVVSGAAMSAAASLIMFVPNLLIFIFMQRKVMDTMANSGIK